MPEGDTIFRTARSLGRALVGKPVTVFRSTYPLLTRFNDDTPIAGQLVERVEARGKWLLIHFSGGGTLATHMLMNGSWHIYRHGERWQQPRFNMRIVIENSDFVAVGFKVPVAEMHTMQSLVRDKRIPQPDMDVLRPDFDAVRGLERIAAHGTKRLATCCCIRKCWPAWAMCSSRRYASSPASIHFAEWPRSRRSSWRLQLLPPKSWWAQMCS